ncbi:MAG: GGDEF domain-containing protein [Lachnospiraceae bacterium]|nr:GGDEF domain-containing protein [Lachnospiraceae bacterium]
MKKRLNIGLFVSNLINDFDIAVYRGVERGAQEMDANLIVFPGRYLRGQYNDKERTKSEYQYNTVFAYADKQNIDVLLVLLGTIGTVITEEEKRTFLDMYRDIPVIILADEMPGYKCLVFENRCGLKDGIVDLIVNKKRKNIGIVSGPMTNEDAVERLNVYKETLQDYGLEVSEDKIVYGNFSEYTEEIVEDLLTRNPEMDAIVFANDQMAIGGYNTIKKHNLVIGKDIAVMGFDDSPMATVLVPNLSTVRADAVELGRRGAIEAVEYVTKGDCNCLPIKTEMVFRESTGPSQGNSAIDVKSERFKQWLQEDQDKLAQEMMNVLYGDRFLEENQKVFVENIIDYIRCFLRFIQEDAEISVAKTNVQIGKALTAVHGEHTEVHLLIQLFGILSDVAKIYAQNKEAEARELLYSNMQRLTMVVTALRQESETELDALLWMSNSIARDMLVYGADSDQSFSTVSDKLIRLGFKSAYLYAMETPFINQEEGSWNDWRVPEKMLLKSFFYNDGQPSRSIEGKEQEISSMKLFDNPYIQQEQRHTLLLNMIFINEEQLGLLLCEIDSRKLQYMNSVNAQLSSALKIIHMLKMQVGIQRQLEESLEKIKESNQVLETISKVDALTGVYNRRGFYEMAAKMIHNKNNRNKKVILLFADLDNLKSINDKIGHDAGDFAIRSIATVLTDSMRATDIVARIGGDEFVAMAVAELDTDGEMIKQRVKTLMNEFNDRSDKNYYIGVSVGYSEFLCEDDIVLEDYLGQADEKLYEDKQKKRKDIMK